MGALVAAVGSSPLKVTEKTDDPSTVVPDCHLADPALLSTKTRVLSESAAWVRERDQNHLSLGSGG